MPRLTTLWTASGAASLVLGFLALLNPAGAGVATLSLIAIGLGLAGVMQAAAAFDENGWRDRAAPLLLALAMIGLAVLTFRLPAIGASLLVAMFAALFLISGIAKMLWAWLGRGEGFLWPALLSGLLSVLLSVLIMVDLHERALRLLGLLIGIELMLNGLVLLSAASSVRRLRKNLEERRYVA